MDLIKLDMAQYMGGRAFDDYHKYLITDILIIVDDDGRMFGYWVLEGLVRKRYRISVNGQRIKRGPSFVYGEK